MQLYTYHKSTYHNNVTS